MRFQFKHRVSSVALSFLVLFSTLSLTVEKHFCGDTLIDVAIFSETEKCGDDFTGTIDSEIIVKSCCKDEIDVLEGLHQVAANSLEDLDILQKQVLFAYTNTYLNHVEGLLNRVIPHKDYSPPLLIKDIQVLDETYLI